MGTIIGSYMLNFELVIVFCTCFIGYQSIQCSELLFEKIEDSKPYMKDRLIFTIQGQACWGKSPTLLPLYFIWSWN